MSRAGTLTWRAEGASHRGSSHERSGAPNQDAYAVLRVGDGLVAAVADGHGGRRYVRSGTGARIAVQLATSLGAELLVGRQPDPVLAGRQLPTRLVPAWRAAVLADLAAHELEDDEVERCGDLPDDPTVLYGATLIVALAVGRTVAVAQVGDGAALTVAAGRTAALVPGDDRLVANETTSLCLPTALDDFRHGSVTVDAQAPRLALLALLATDGYGNSFASEQWEPEVMSDLGTEVDRHGFDTVCASMPAWVAESAQVGGDDVTVVLLTCTEAVRDAPRGPAGPASRHRWWLPGLALSLLAIAAVLLVARPWAVEPATTTPPVTPVADTRQPPVTTTAPSTTSSATATTAVSTTPTRQGQPVPRPAQTPTTVSITSTTTSTATSTTTTPTLSQNGPPTSAGSPGTPIPASPRSPAPPQSSVGPT